MDELNTLIGRLIQLSYYRAIDKENPIDFVQQPDKTSPETWIIISSFTEPTFAKTPYNVLWLVMDPADLNYGKILRRVTHEATSFNYRSQWDIVTSVSELYSETQYYRPIVDDPSLYGLDEAAINLDIATDVLIGVARLAPNPNGAPVQPIGILTDDPRMSDDRYPTLHDHDNYARYMIKIGGDKYAVANTSQPPSLGMILFLEEIHPLNPNIYLAKWRFPLESDVSFVDRSLVSIVINGSGTAAEQAEEQYTVTATFADGSTSNITPDVWTITQNPSAASIDRNTGILTTHDITSDTTIVMSASYTLDGITKTATKSVVISADEELVALTIEGPSTVASGSDTPYTVRAEMSSGAINTVTPATFTSSNGATSTTGSRLIVSQVFENGTTTLTATYTYKGVTLTATKNVNITAAAILPTSVTILGATQITEGGNAVYTYEVGYNNGTTVQRSSVTSLVVNNTAVATVANNTLTSINGAINANTTVRLTASLTESGVTVTGYLDVLIVNVQAVVPNALRIRVQGGPDANASSHNEKQTLSIIYQAEFSDNVGVWVDVSADPNFTAGLASPTNGAVLSSDKLSLTLPDVVGNKVATVQASITRNGVTKTASYAVTIVDTNTYFTDFRVRLASNPTQASNSSTQNEGQTLGLVYQAKYSNSATWTDIDSTNANLTVSLANANGATLSADKSSITLPDVSADYTLTINGSFTDMGATNSGSYSITVHDTDIHVVGFRIRLASAPNATTSSSSHAEKQTLTFVYQVAMSDAPTTWVTLSSLANVTASVSSSNPNVVLNNKTSLVLPEVTANTTATINAVFNDGDANINASYVVTITDVVVTLLELRVRLESDPTNTSNSITVDENQTIRVIYRARFSDAPATWVNVSADPKLAANIQSPNLGVTIGSDKQDIIIPDVNSNSQVTLRGTYTLNGTPTAADLVININNTSVGQQISPRWGTAPVQAYVADYATPAFYNLLTAGNLTGVNGDEITTLASNDQSQLWYMMYPKTWGYLYVVNKGTGLAGSWDGGKITTQDGQFGSPAEVSVNGVAYYIYRVTFPYGAGPITWQITYGSSSPASGTL